MQIERGTVPIHSIRTGDQRFFKLATRTDRPLRLAFAAGLGAATSVLCGACAASPADADGWTAAAWVWRRDLAPSFAEEISVERACAIDVARRAEAASRVTRGDSGILNRFAAGIGSMAGAPAAGNAVCRGHRPAGAEGTPRPRRVRRAPRSVVCQSRLDRAGAGSVAGPAAANFATFGQRDIATISDGGCSSHC